MKVLFIAGQLGGGGAERQLALFLEHSRGRFEPSCLLLNGGGVWEEPVRKLCARFHVARSRVPPFRALEFLGVARRWQPDLIHCWHAYPFVYPLVTRVLHGRPVVANVRGDLTVHGESGREGFPWFYRLLSRVDVVVANQAHSLEALRQRGVAPRVSRVIANGIETTEAPRSAGEVPPVRVVGAGSFRPIKNWLQLIRVCGGLLRAGRPLSLTIYGEGRQREELETACAEFGFDPRRTLPGYDTDLRRRLADADILVHCSLSEGLPNVILEALAEGLPVVASDLEVCRDLQRESGCLELFPTGDDDGLREKLDRLIENPELRDQRGRPGREFVRRNFDPDEMARQYLELYQELLKR